MTPRLFFLLALAAGVAASGYWAYRTPAPEPRIADDGPRAVEASMRRVTITDHDLDGRPARRLEAAHLLQYADSDESILWQPRVTLLDRGPSWRLDAPYGRWRHDAGAELILLQEAVRIRREAGPDGRALAVDTRDLAIFPGREEAWSAHRSVIRDGAGRLVGTGLHLAWPTERVRLLADVHGGYRVR
ncbi:lipopolysaccharide export system protein LptC [Thiohalospira halophila DSM 15071]|jgi:lipopolysaccharide export system protein LptC|uniref:Lipopolysaccharide export system protein LptC n=1 Tax=Thiohalospira halophila DSM 15071 TaxID=1123397 RepID=A0A1I1QUR0_9GAMM|nr:LPS export ABC transporter periplasmic protein LptC [Thiohalospira halophila]SFD25819.1 lipopolysaccharide export system protein LptC [Thiohalospira halophila DSM 15071]